MQRIKQIVTSVVLNRRILAAAFIIIGLGVIVFFGMRSIKSYRQLQYAREQGLNQGTAA